MNNKLRIVQTDDYVLAVSDEKIEIGDIVLETLNDGKQGLFEIHTLNDIDLTRQIKVAAYLPKFNAPKLDLPLLPKIATKDYSLEAAKKFAYSKFENLKENFPEGKGMVTIQSILDVLEAGVEYGYKFASKNNKIVVEDDVKKLAESAYVKHRVKDNLLSLYEEIQRTGGFLVGFKEGFKAATKTYSEEDLRKAIELAVDKGRFWISSPIADDEYKEELSNTKEDIIQSLKQPKIPTWFFAETELLTRDTSECIGIDGEPNDAITTNIIFIYKDIKISYNM